MISLSYLVFPDTLIGGSPRNETNNPENLYGQKSLGLSHKQDHQEPIPIPYAVYDFEFYWNYKLRIKNNSSKTAYNIKIEKIVYTHFII